MTHTVLLLVAGVIIGAATRLVDKAVRRRRRVSAVARAKGISRAAAAAWIDIGRPLR